MPVRTVLCTSEDVNSIINEHYSREKVDAEIAERSQDDAGEAKEAQGLSKTWEKIKKWTQKNE